MNPYLSGVPDIEQATQLLRRRHAAGFDLRDERLPRGGPDLAIGFLRASRRPRRAAMPASTA